MTQRIYIFRCALKEYFCTAFTVNLQVCGTKTSFTKEGGRNA